MYKHNSDIFTVARWVTDLNRTDKSLRRMLFEGLRHRFGAAMRLLPSPPALHRFVFLFPLLSFVFGCVSIASVIPRIGDTRRYVAAPAQKREKAIAKIREGLGTAVPY